MSGGLRPWLGERLESELETAVDYWAEGAATRANNPSSQQLAEVFENDGSNLRLKVYMSAIERPLAQIVKFTQVQEDAPIEAIISDRKNSIKARFSGKVASDFENKAKRPITSKTEGGILSITQFELVIPILSTIDEDPIYILLILADIKGFGGSPIHDEPSPVQRRPKMERLLNQLHNVKSEDPEEVRMDDLAMRSDDDMLSQGAPEEEAYSQFGTQMRFSQLPVLKRSNSQVETRIRKGQSPTVESPRLTDQGRGQEPQLILELLRSRTRPTTAADKSLMPPPAPPRTVPQTTQSVRSRSFSRSQSPDVGPQKAEKVIDQNECILVADNSPGKSDEDEPVLGVEKDGTEQVNEQGGQAEAVNAGSPINRIDFEDAGPTVDIPSMPDSRNVDTIPTSYQIPVASSSNVPTTNSSIPSIVPTIKNDIPYEAPRNRKGPWIYHNKWNCILPFSRSVCRIPQDQDIILKKSNSILPSPIGQTFPMGNVPSAILTDLSALAKQRHCQATDVREQGQGHVNEDNSSSGWIPRPSPARELPDSSGDILSTQPPPATPPSWSSSPVQPKQRFADLPPDSSFSEAQDLSGMSRSGRDQDRAGLRHDGIEPSSSPPLPPLSPKIREDENDEDSDLEISIPRPLSDIKASQSRSVPKRPQVQPHALSSQPGGPKASMSRQISSSSALYTHLHLSGTPNGTTSSDSRPRRSSTEVRQSSPRKERYITHSSAPVTPCSHEIAREPHKKAPEIVTAFDGAAESEVPVFPDNENALVERQIRNEMGSECSQQLSRIAASERGHREVKSPSAKMSSPGRRSSFSANSPSTPHSEGLSSKREAHSPLSDLNHKRVKKISSRYHFSQDEPLPHMSQNPSEFFRERRRQFFQDGIGARDIPLSHRHSASSSHASSPSRSVSPPSSQLRARDQQVTGQGQQSPNNCEQGRPHISQQPSGSSSRPLASLHEGPKLSQASSPSNSDERILDSDHAPLPITDTDKVSQTIPHDAMGVDERFQVARVDSAPQPTANAQSTSAKEDTDVVEETVLPVHSESFGREARNAPNTSTSVALGREISTPKSSLSNAKQSQARDLSGTSVGDSEGREILVTRTADLKEARASGTLFEEPPKDNGKSKRRTGMSQRKRRSRIEKALKKVHRRLQKQAFREDGILTTSQECLRSEQNRLFKQAAKYGFELQVSRFEFPYQPVEVADPMEGISEYEDGLSEISDWSFIQSRSAEKRVGKVVSNGSDDESVSDTGSLGNSGNRLRSALAGIAGDISFSDNGTSQRESARVGEENIVDLTDQTKAALTRSVSSVVPAQQNVQGDQPDLNHSGGSEQARQSKNSGSRRTLSVAQADPVGSTSAVPNTDEIFAQFCRAYPEYTGTRKHFENLCGTLDKLVRNSKGGFHPFLWDDYIARNWTEYKPYTEECLKEGTQFLHWDDYYFERVRRPNFTEEVVNEDTLAKVLASQDNRQRPITLRKASGLDHGREKTSTPNVTVGRSDDPFSRTGGYGRPEHPKEQQERQAQPPNPPGSNRILVEPRRASRQQQQGSLGSPIQQHPRHPSPPPAAAATSPPPAALRSTQPPASTHAIPRKPPPPAPGSAFKQNNTNSTGAVPLPPPPRVRAHGRIPTASNQQAGPPSSSSPSAMPPVKRPRPPGISAPPPPAKRLETSTTAPPPSSLATTAARPQTKERTLSGMPAPPPRTTPARQVEKNMFSLFKQRYYNGRHSGSDRGEDRGSGSSRAGSTV